MPRSATQYGLCQFCLAEGQGWIELEAGARSPIQRNEDKNIMWELGEALVLVNEEVKQLLHDVEGQDSGYSTRLGFCLGCVI